MNETVDGDYQTFKSKDGAYVREHFFGKYPETAALVADWTDEQIWALNRGGHDPKKVYAALKKAQETKGKATVILAHTIKGYGMGDTAEGKNIAHQVKKMNMDGVRYIRDRFNVPVTDEQVENCRTSPSRKVPKSTPTCTNASGARLSAEPSAELHREAGAADAGRFLSAAGRAEQRDLYHYRFRSCPERDAEEQVDQRSPRADHRRRSAYFRYGRSVPSDRYLQPERPAVHPAGP
jgi:pyruvate dehydrogenase E1 component